MRDRKREQNRVKTVEVAWRLFMERGYDNVTVADICAAADIAPRTFHRYFAAKEDVVTDPIRRMAAIVTDHLASAPAGLAPAELISAAMREVGAFVADHREWLAALRHVARQSQHLRAAHAGVPPEQEAEIVRRLAALSGKDEDDWRVRVLVVNATGVFRVWYDDYLAGTLDDPLPRLDAMLATLTQGVPPVE
ncbi:TetR/AcrR family transcriptional regulator [Paractinoplanes atraurantiacus]|uniref:DNA-binding transcriptional regulator, AcrR family n=1 Tax=Paractinoplanes atraurantiacus TaxID=1036182 RepID=A0A285KK66_9ACTN|nr:TetR family transcriptional regulator [Actinoplanes atraurantiacus]SNY73039.1 DNA-binding transcriptional regulator, AcrR family [Actinoplanes atraurantiacus]